MTQEEKQLLLIDLCAKLPYGVCVHIRYKTGEPCYGKLTPRDIQWFIDSNIEVIKPYLRPMSSMTEEEKRQLRIELNAWIEEEDCGRHTEEYGHTLVYHEGEWLVPFEAIDWLNEHHFDYRGLIGKDLALVAPEGMYD